MNSVEKIGLIAGNRRFPLVFAQAAKKKGASIVAVAIKGETSPRLARCVDKLYWLRLSEFNRMFDLFRQEGVSKVVMAGQISPRRLFSREVSHSSELKSLLSAIQDRKANSIFGIIAEKLKVAGLTLLDSTTFIEDLLPEKATLTKREPTLEERDNIRFGLQLAKEIARLDIGLTIAVKHKAVIAVEAFEGTDNLISRAGKLARGGLVVVKVGRPSQDMRFDIPVVGLATVQRLIKAKATCLAIEAGKTLFLDSREAIALADRKGLAITAV